jgi:hypothetical protein
MSDEPKERVIAMHVNRVKSGPRDRSAGTSPADLLLGRSTPQRDRGGDGQEAEPAQPVPVRVDGGDPGGGSESFDPESPDYKAFGWAGNATLPAFSIILKDGSALGVNYADLASAHQSGSVFLPSAPGCKGNVIRLRVAGDAGVFLVVLEGLRLWRVWELIMSHKTSWIRELPERMDLVGGNEPVIWTITFPEPARMAAGGGR